MYIILAYLIIGLSCISPLSNNRIEVLHPTVQQEASSIWNTINDITFLEQQGYNINLPKDRIIDSLVIKSKKGVFGNNDFPTIYNLVETKLFQEENYSKAIQKVNSQIGLINLLVKEIETTKKEWDWTFNMLEQYKINFTLYGTGGSYDPDNGTITLFTDQDGNFMNYQNPVNTIVHEIAHMGMEYSIVRKYNLPHGLKERVVDTFVYLLFKEKLPEYEIQNMGYDKIDNYLNKPEDIGSLNSIISEFVNK